MEYIRYRNGKKQIVILPESSRQRIIHALKTRKTSNKVIDRAGNLNKGKFGKSHPCYRPEKKRRLYKQIREIYKYRQWRTKVFEHDNYTCVLCGWGNGKYVEADHYPKLFIEIIRENKIKTLEQALNCEKLWTCKGRTLCRKCHIKNTDFHILRPRK